MSTDIMVPCGHCAGEGSVCHPRLTACYAVIPRDRWISTRAIAKRLRLGATNAANLTAELRRMDLVERRGSGSRHSPYEWKRKHG